MPDGARQPSDAEVLERLVQEGMARMRWTRKKAEVAAKRYLNRLGKKTAPGTILDRIDRLNPPLEPPKPNPKKRVVKKQRAVDALVATPPVELAAARASAPDAKKLRRKRKKKAGAAHGKLTPEAIAKLPPVNSPPPPPRNAKERLERALGPDDGRPRRGGGWLLQGGSPGLGRRS